MVDSRLATAWPAVLGQLTYLPAARSSGRRDVLVSTGRSGAGGAALRIASCAS